MVFRSAPGLAGADRILGAMGTVYLRSKSVLRSLTRGLAQDVRSKDIAANPVQPGSTDTDMNFADGEYVDFHLSLTPLGRYATPADVAAAVTFLASQAARHITGTIIKVDGGMLT